MNILKHLLAALAVASILSTLNAEEVSSKSEKREASGLNMPKNLARTHMGASLLSEKNGKYSRVPSKSDEIALIGDDEALSFSFEKKARSLVIDLGAKYPVHTFAFKSYSAKGQVRVMTATRLRKPDSSQWSNVAEAESFVAGDLVQVTFRSMDARFVRVDFEGLSGGEISNVNVSGDVTISDVVKHGRIRLGELKEFQAAAKDTVEIEVDFASLYAGSNINLAGVTTGGGSLQNMFDENLRSFAGIVGEDRGRRSLTVDLKQASSLNKLSLNVEGFEGDIVVDSIYGKESKTVARANVGGGKELVQIEFDESSFAEKVKITFKGTDSGARGLSDVGDPLAGTRIYEMSLIGKRIVSEKELEEPLVFFPVEEATAFSAAPSSGRPISGDGTRENPFVYASREDAESDLPGEQGIIFLDTVDQESQQATVSGTNAVYVLIEN